jgi:PIN domain nuclease of toxin-antitoxin system
VSAESSHVLDSSALLAYLRGEPGAERVAALLTGGVVISAVNWAEVLSKVADEGEDPERLATELSSGGLLGAIIAVVPFTAEDSVEVARLRVPTRSAGLSLGDRVCLGLATRLGVPAVTADRIWAGLSLDVQIIGIRP